MNSLILIHLSCVDQSQLLFFLMHRLFHLRPWQPHKLGFWHAPKACLWWLSCFLAQEAPGSTHTFPTSSLDSAISLRSPVCFSRKWCVRCYWVVIASVNWFRKCIFFKKKKPKIFIVIFHFKFNIIGVSLNFFNFIFVCLFCYTKNLDS